MALRTAINQSPVERFEPGSIHAGTGLPRKSEKKMKSTAVLLLALCCLVLVSTESDSNNSIKIRRVRGFRNSQLATARGFGKRTSFALLDSLMSSENGAVYTSWPVEKLSKSPQIAQVLLSKFVDTDGDGIITADEISRDV